MAGRRGLAAGFAIVIASMLILFTVPSSYFVGATFISTTCMVGAAYARGVFGTRQPRLRSVALGLATAALLYGIFYGGAWLVSTYHPFGITSASETSIYSLISSPTNSVYLQAAVLLFDSAGYESYFRGALQRSLRPRFGIMAAPAVASFDAVLHVATLNPLWVGATFVTDILWGVTYHYGGTQSSFTSHFVWDVAIFILRPIR
ncbi:MAG TPA: CPBP family glutamic-type intramembrane protease [Nitrososphaerales archaeon]|nr:CPBP family glutamic-type intramembrane protease [Nitrososphaerales archaeon]